ncbi:MAG: molybdopterin converting factor subunit 1 [Reyranellaceae bacterium]
MKVKYFAWLRQKVGLSEEEVSPPAEVATVQDLVTWLSRRSARHADAFAEAKVFGAAIDKKVATFTAPISGASEVAFFPPFTGG